MKKISFVVLAFVALCFSMSFIACGDGEETNSIVSTFVSTDDSIRFYSDNTFELSVAADGKTYTGTYEGNASLTSGTIEIIITSESQPRPGYAYLSSNSVQVKISNTTDYPDDSSVDLLYSGTLYRGDTYYPGMGSTDDTTDSSSITAPDGFVAVTGATVSTSTLVSTSAFYNASTYPVTVNSFYIATTELTYSKWYEVYQWATSSERGDNVYTFQNLGREGHDGTDGAEPTEDNSEPVTCISYRDAVVWCNAASEMEGLDPVYYSNGEILRTAENYEISGSLQGTNSSNTSNVSSGNGKAEACTYYSGANGYRLPTGAEWEFAGRGGKPSSSAWTREYQGTSDYMYDNYGIYGGGVNANGSVTGGTQNVKSKDANVIGLYDMHGNVQEMCWETISSTTILSTRYARGGAWNDGGNYCSVSSVDAVTITDNTSNTSTSSSSTKYGDTGFRLVRTITQ